MSAKHQRLEQNEISERAARLYKLLEASEWIVEDSGEEPTTDYSFIYVKDINSLYMPDEYKDLVREGNAKIAYQNLYIEIFKQFFNLSNKVLLDEGYAQKTRDTEIEYMLILLKSGKYAIFEGDIDKVSIPLPPGIGLAHTHPHVCLFSYKDIETTSYLFEKGYITSSVITTECTAHLSRLGPYTIDDLKALKDLHKRLEKAKTLDEVVKVYNDFKSNSVKLFLSLNQP
ncbi:MAG: hypothetical protein OWQ54_01165 [Sulfolobaceae archaeon]|nr:hypothetical protein [Sulfolobaceae archaeon]